MDDRDRLSDLIRRVEITQEHQSDLTVELARLAKAIEGLNRLLTAAWQELDARSGQAQSLMSAIAARLAKDDDDTDEPWRSSL